MLCLFVRLKLFKEGAGIRRFDPKVGTIGFIKHTDTHCNDAGTLNRIVCVKVTQIEKHELVFKAFYAAVHGLLPLSFVYNRPGMISFAYQLVKIGHNLPPTVAVDIVDLLPSIQGFADSLQSKAQETRQIIARKHLPKIMQLGRGISFDGLKQPLSGWKYYDLVLHYVNSTKHLLTVKIDFGLRSRVLVLVEHKAAESSEKIHKNLDCGLKERYGFGLDHLMHQFTLSTDWAATLPNIVVASASISQVPFGCKWIGCVVHKLNTIL